MMNALTTFQESENIAEQINVLIQVIYDGELCTTEKKVLTGIALNLSQELLTFCKAGAKDEEDL